ncbi:MAG: hypothetical protein ACKPB0_07625 [Opitutaceae bacterium]
MPHWEYKVITSGKGGFASPAMLEKFLNDLGREEWEIIHYLTPPDNALAFTGLARRSTQRDWTLEDAAAAAAKAEAEKLRAEFEAKFRAAASPAAEAAAEEGSPAFIEDKSAAEEGLRKLVDTSRDAEPEADGPEDDWDKLTAAEEEELPTFFEAIRPHMRRNQRGPGMSVGVEYLAKKWDQSEDDVKGALVECGFVMPADEDSPVEHLEYDGDLYWLNINRRGELWINTKEKPRQIFKAVKGTRIEPPPAEAAPAPAEGSAPAEAGERKPAEAAPSGESSRPAPQPLPEGPALIEKIRPHLRRNRRGPGGSGSLGFLARALRVKEADLKAAFGALGLTMPATPGDQAVYTDLGTEQWWLNLDSRGGLWINGREKREGEPAPASETSAPVSDANASAPPASETAAGAVPSGEPAPAPVAAPVAEATASTSEAPAPAPAASAPVSTAILEAVRPFLKETRTGGIAGSVERLAGKMEKPAEELVAALVAAGLKVPEKSREKPVYAGHADEQFWFNLSGKGELWLNVRAAKAADEEDAADDEAGDEADEAGDKPAAEGRKPARGGRSRSKKKAD